MPERASGITKNTQIESRERAKTPSTTKRVEAVVRQDELASKSQAPTAVQPVEPEDAYLTGVSRSLQRRLLGLNVQGPRGQAKTYPEATVAGLHSTGSFTGAKSVPAKSPKIARKAQSQGT